MTAAALAAAPGTGIASVSSTVPPPPPCVAQVVPVVLVNHGAYSPRTLTTVTPGSTVEWQWNTGGAAESVTSTGGLPLMASRAKTTGTYDFRFWSAGSYPYHSSADPSQKGVINIGMCNVPKTARVGHLVEFQVASAHRRGWVADVEVLRPGATKWAWLRTNVTTRFTSFTPKRAGTFRLRARLRDKLIKQFSAFSPISTIRVS